MRLARIRSSIRPPWSPGISNTFASELIRVIKTRVAFYYLEIETKCHPISIFILVSKVKKEGIKFKFNLKKYLILWKKAVLWSTYETLVNLVFFSFFANLKKRDTFLNLWQARVNLIFFLFYLFFNPMKSISVVFNERFECFFEIQIFIAGKI